MTTNNRQKTEYWTTIIRTRESFHIKELYEILQYKGLIAMFVKRDFKTMYAQTILGPLWFVVHALLSSSIMTVVFGGIVGVSTNEIPTFIFYLSGNLIWNNFSGCLSSVSNTFLSNVKLMGKVYFPRLCVPIASVISKQIRFFIQFGVFLVLLLIYGMRGMELQFGWELILLPVILLMMMSLALGCGLILSACTIKYKDFSVLIGFMIQFWMYLTPVVYPMTEIPEQWKQIFWLNPMAPILETFRAVWFDTATIPYVHLAASAGMTILLLVAGVHLFYKAQRHFLDTV